METMSEFEVYEVKINEDDVELKLTETDCGHWNWILTLLNSYVQYVTYVERTGICWTLEGDEESHDKPRHD